MDERQRLALRRKRRQQLRRRRMIRRILCVVGVLIVLILIIRGVIIPAVHRSGSKEDTVADQTETDSTGMEASADTGTSVGQSSEDEIAAALSESGLYATQYDYDKAMERVRQVSNYESVPELKTALETYQQQKDSCVEYPLEQITHVFFHSLIVDPSKAFDGDNKTVDYNQVMTTVDEFNKIMQIMYDKGFVLISLHDMAEVNEAGIMTPRKIMLPPGKTPFVLSQDDVSYYHYMDGDGYATKLIIDENGQVKNEYLEDDGSISVGDYDMVPLLDTFVREHPDFSYHGRKGILAMTGYDGVLGYRTDRAYDTLENLDEDQRKFLEANPDFDFEEECRQAKEVADAMKATGWEFASHTWGHRNATESSAEQLQIDDEKWKTRNGPILGDTDVIIFAFGADIGDSGEYTMDNPKFAYFKNAGYDYYCPVDGNQYWVQLTDLYLRQGRRNLDGYRMYYNPEMLTDLFDVKDVWDNSRPTPVEPMA